MVSFKQFMFEIMDSGNLSHSSKIDIFYMNHGLYVSFFLFTTVISQRSIRYYACTSLCNRCKKRCHFIKKTRIYSEFEMVIRHCLSVLQWILQLLSLECSPTLYISTARAWDRLILKTQIASPRLHWSLLLFHFINGQHYAIPGGGPQK